MKKTASLLLFALCLSLFCACGKQAEHAPDMQAIFSKMTALEGTPELFTVEPEKAEYIFGIMREDCIQEVVAVCLNSLLADELWLLEARDADTAARLEALASERLEQKAAETKDYSPDQYQIVKNGQVLRKGNCVALIVSDKSAQMAALFG